MWLLMSTLAYGSGFYHPADVAAVSKQYARAADVVGKGIQDRADRAGRVARALDDYEVALDLLGDRAPAAERERHHKLKMQYNREFAVLQAFTDTLVEDFDNVFSKAVTRALPGAGNPEPCQAQIPAAKPLPGMPVRMKANPDCTGDDKNQAIASTIDGDAQLIGALDEILALELPAITVDNAAQAPIGEASGWVAVHPFFAKGAREGLRRIAREDDEARLPFQAAIEDGADKGRLKALADEAAKVTEATAAKRAALAAPVLAAADKAQARWAKKGNPTAGWCANPAALGGCTGEDRSDAVGSELYEDKKVDAALEGS